MKKKRQTFNKELKMPRLFREDLITIEKIIKEELLPKEYKIETNDYEYESVDIIPTDHKAVLELHILTFSPYISIDFNKHGARVFASDDDLRTTGALTKILKILKKKERKIFFWFLKIAIWAAPILGFGPLMVLKMTGNIESITLLRMALGLSILAVIWWSVSYYYSLYKFSVINFVLSKERLNFFQKNKDQIILLIIGAILGVIFTKLF